MGNIENLSNSRLINKGLSFNLTTIGIFLFTLYFSIVKSFIGFEVAFSLLSVSIAILLFSCLVINRKGIIITRIDIMWFIFLMVFILNITLNNLITISTIIDILIYSLAILFLLLVKVDIDYYDSSLKLVKVFGIIYACSAIFQYLYPDVYLNSVLPLFGETEQLNILSLLRSNSYAGFTDQTAHLAGYTVSGVGVIIFSKWKNKLSANFLSLLAMFVLFIGLLLTAKRAHLIFMIIAILMTILFSINNKKLIKDVMKLLLGLLTAILVVVILFISTNSREESPIIDFLNEIENTATGFIEGEDVTSGRTVLYSHALELFYDNSITGIGWKEFINNSIGLINSDRGSHPHNIYLQLLSELGIIGFVLFLVPVLYVYYKTFRMLRVLSAKGKSLQKWKYGIQFSFFSQTFFILYGMTGNLLTDYNFLLLYFFSCSISLSALVRLKLNYNKEV